MLLFVFEVSRLKVLSPKTSSVKEEMLDCSSIQLMKTISKIVLVLASLFLAYQTYQLMAALISSQGQKFPWFMAFLFAFLLDLFATGIFAFAGFEFPTHRLLPKSYYRIKNPDAVAKWDDLLRVSIFRKFLMIIFWGKEKNRK